MLFGQEVSASNRDTLRALAANGIDFDSSYNATLFGPASGVMPGVTVVEPIKCEGVFEYPMTVFNDGMGSLRHVQLTACSYGEIENLLWKALEDKRNSFIILFHNFELLNSSKNSEVCVYWFGERYQKRNFWSLNKNEAKLVQIVTIPEARGRGLATALIALSCRDMMERGFCRTYARNGIRTHHRCEPSNELDGRGSRL